ncbi:MAG: leucyl/phenylalanyl-tRNA--protein transferase [Candidatus Electrothrix scaldis]|nr:MAG: leucyl/phenylalanyl-tRNA--protein transferase [Candidatus Electrothrix sp. GW3-3]
MPVFRLPQEIVFPDPQLAEPDGLLAVGGDLSPGRIIAAYHQGIFPWYSDNEPILWWSPVPRLVLLPEEFHLPKRLARTLRKNIFEVRADTAFAQVISSCATVRQEAGEGTWITKDMQEAYVQLHNLGFAHSLETWFEGELVGGLYGICLDRFFFGESMFSRRNDASKVALTTFMQNAEHLNIRAIDCQMTTKHMLRFGSRERNREEFDELLEQFIQQIRPQAPWRLLGQDKS